MIFYLLGILGYYKAIKKPVPAGICLAFFFVVLIPPLSGLLFLVNVHWIFAVILFVTGWFCWTFTEYFIHRFWMHRKENNGYRKGLHFQHHIHPEQIFTSSLVRIIMLFITALMIGAGVIYTNYLLLPAGFAAGYTLYNFIHVLLHHPHAVRYVPALQAFHVQHHCGDANQCFGVTVTWWDLVFNTHYKMVKKVEVKKRNFFFGKLKAPVVANE